MRAWCALLVLIGWPVPRAAAHELMNLLADRDAPHRVYLITAVDPTVASGVGYAYALPIDAVARVVDLSADLAAPWFAFDGRHYRLDVGARLPLLRYRDVQLAGRLHLQLAGGKNWVHTATAIRFEGSLVVGYFQPRFFVDVEAGIAHTPLTYLVHGDRFRDSQYAEVVDGWYSGTGGRLSLAVEGGYRVSACWELGLRAGRYTTLELGAPQGLPYFADVVVTRHF